jgi:drug/metabolite transporter (DMT)-like permease
MSAEFPLSVALLTRRTVGSTVGLGIFMMFFGDFMFAVNDIMGKWLAGTFSAGQIVLTRSLAALVVLAPLLMKGGAPNLVRLEKPGVQVSRVAMATAELVFFYMAIRYLPLADVMTFYLAGPIYVAAVSPWLLGEQVSRRQWLAIAIGFAGVVVVLRPGSGSLSWPALISIGGSLCYAMVVVQSRQLRSTPDRVLVFWQTIGALVIGGILSPFDWVTPSLADLLMLAALGIVSMTAHLCITRSLKLAPAAVVAPIQYSLLLWAILFGWLVFGDRPQLPMLIGAAVIVIAGLMVVSGRGKQSQAAAEAD